MRRRSVPARALSLALLLGSASGAAALYANPVEATVVVPLSREQLVEWSDYVLRATVVSQRAQWNSAHTLIVTRSVLRVHEYLKGQGPSELVLVTSGGVVDGVEHETHGESRLEAGREYVLFTQHPRDAFVTLTALGQSVYEVVAPAGGNGEATVRRDRSGVAFMNPARDGRRVLHLEDEQGEALRALAASVRSLAARGAR